MVARDLSPVSTTNAKVLPITGTHQNVASSLAIGVYSGSAGFVSGAVDQVAYVFNKLRKLYCLSIKYEQGTLYALYGI